jgi:hypothetical protein
VQALDVDGGGHRGGRPIGDDGEPADNVYDELPAYNEDKALPRNPATDNIPPIALCGRW